MKLKFVGLLLLLCAVTFFVLGRKSVRQETRTYPVQVPNWTAIRTIKALGEIFPITIPGPGGRDTIRITAETPMGEVPPRWVGPFPDSISLLVHDTLRQIRFELEMEIVGELLRYKHSGTDQRFDIVDKAPAPPKPGDWQFHIYGALFHDLTAAGIAVASYKRVGVIGMFQTERLDMDQTQAKARIGIAFKIL